MKPAPRRLALLVAGAALIICLLLRLASGKQDPATAPSVTAAAERAPVAPLAEAPLPAPPPETQTRLEKPRSNEVNSTPPKSAYARITVKAGQPIPELFPFQAERDQLIALATTYDPRNIPAIAASLNHSDATVREAARQALVQIGDRAAVPYLERAKETAKDATEAEAIKETIDFLSLPHVIDVLSLSAASNQTTQP